MNGLVYLFAIQGGSILVEEMNEIGLIIIMLTARDEESNKVLGLDFCITINFQNGKAKIFRLTITFGPGINVCISRLFVRREGKLFFIEK